MRPDPFKEFFAYTANMGDRLIDSLDSSMEAWLGDHPEVEAVELYLVPQGYGYGSDSDYEIASKVSTIMDVQERAKVLEEELEELIGGYGTYIYFLVAGHRWSRSYENPMHA